jgi:hypothetical protein
LKKEEIIQEEEESVYIPESYQTSENEKEPSNHDFMDNEELHSEVQKLKK